MVLVAGPVFGLMVLTVLGQGSALAPGLMVCAVASELAFVYADFAHWALERLVWPFCCVALD